MFPVTGMNIRLILQKKIHIIIDGSDLKIENTKNGLLFLFNTVVFPSYKDIPAYGVVSYDYDRTGNRTSYFGPERYGNYAYNAANQLTEAYENEQQLLYSYDAAGNLTQKSDPINTTTYAYDGLGRMSRATTPTDTVDYSYDALGRKDSRTHNGNTLYHHYLAKTDLIDYKTDSSGGLNTEVVRGPDGMVNYTVHTAQGPVTAFEHFSPHGDTVLVTSENGDTRAIARYDSFGNALTGGGLANGYTGKWQREKDGRTGLIDMGVRDYDPQQGRFIQVDPLEGSVTSPQQRNRYQYVQNNPLVRYDLDGRLDLNPFNNDEEEEEDDEGVFDQIGNFFFGDDEEEHFDEEGNRTELPPYHSGAEEVGLDASEFYYGEDLENLTSEDSSVEERIAGGVFLGLNFVPGGKAAKCGKAAKKLSFSSKIEKQMMKRGWTKQMIDEAKQTGQKVKALNKRNGNPATRYIHPGSGQSVVVDDVTGEVIQVGGPDFKFGTESGDLP
jgi:RHS repeat-associated protein